MAGQDQKTVLVCDDEAPILESIRYLVGKEGHRCLTASDGGAGLALARSERPDVIVLDVNMPVMTGYEVCEQLKNDPDMQFIHVLILTAHGQAKDAERAEEVGADAFMSKPFSPRQFREHLRSILT